MTLENAARLAEMRRAHGLSQEELAERLGVSRQAVSKWERAESSPDTDNLIALAQLYGVSLDVLLGLQLPHTPDAVDAAEYEVPAGLEEESIAMPASEPEDFSADADAPINDPLPNGSYYEHAARAAEKAAEEAAAQEAYEREARRNRYPYPLIVAFAYLVLGFCFHLWHPGWIIFLTIPLFYLPERERKPILLLGNPVMVTIIYLLLGTQCGWWHPGWLVFFLIPLINSVRR